MNTSLPSNFRGFLWEPCGEQEVVVLFGRLLALDLFGPPLCIERTRTTFPDCTAIDPETGEKIRIEFEYRSSSFCSHRKEWEELTTAHSSERWWVVCWHDDLNTKQKQGLPNLRIVSLKEVTRAQGLVLNWYDGDPEDKDYAEELFDWRSAGLSTGHREVINRLRQFGQTENGFNVEWPCKQEFPKFIVWNLRSQIRCFGVSADGTIGVPFSKWHAVPIPLRKEVIARLNSALRTEWFTNKESKKKGCDAAYLLRNGDAIDPFLGVWRWLSSRSTP